ncbi:hypothetical protein PMIN03_003564 [Paraphaeosphaeria minitans]|uniref:F-box domain-containing protein n=1 Tax=Paraphaeosphaeria minitans TaxID=565426 RepID=A0A9P6KRW1_9PLEO|nr:hypothetical protein PMIN01_04992 [Paraphaeosphaeria minitans]
MSTLPHLPTEIWEIIVGFSDPLTNYTGLRATNKFFANLAERDFKKGCAALLDSATLEIFTHPIHEVSGPTSSFHLSFSFDRVTHDTTRACFKPQDRDPLCLDLEGPTGDHTQETQHLSKIQAELGAEKIPDWAAVKELLNKTDYLLDVGYTVEVPMLTARDPWCRFWHRNVPLQGLEVDIEKGEISIEWMPTMAAVSGAFARGVAAQAAEHGYGETEDERLRCYRDVLSWFCKTLQ